MQIFSVCIELKIGDSIRLFACNLIGSCYMQKSIFYGFFFKRNIMHITIKNVSCHFFICTDLIMKQFSTICKKCPNLKFFLGPYFPTYRLNTKFCSLNLRIQSKSGKIRTRKNSKLDQFSRSGCESYIQAVARIYGYIYGMQICGNSPC